MLLMTLALLLSQDDLTVLKAEDQPRKMLYRYLEAECGKKFDERRKAVAALATPEDVKKRQEMLRAKFIEALGGFPDRTPLNPRVTGTLQGDGFKVEKVIYESRPDHHITANLYIPSGKGPFPGVLVPCGHSENGKAVETYQRACILMAKNGLAVLCYDPIGQGERKQLLNEKGEAAIKGSTTEHTMVEVGALLVGWSTATFRIWDGIRSLDYLASRPEVDPKKLGCTGNSGGGTMTAYLMALDERIVAAAPSCYITTLERLFATIGPQDGEQNITGQVAFGMEHTDYVTMRAPRPTLICIGTQDYFDAQGAWTTFREAKRIYGMLGHGERVDLFEYNDKHGFSKPRREAAMRWMRRWLLGRDDAPVEGDFPVFKDAELQCTETGQVLSALKGKSVFDFIAARARELNAARGPVLIEDVRRRLAFGVGALEAKPGKAVISATGEFAQPAVWKSPSNLILPGVVHSHPDPWHRKIVFLGSSGKHQAAREWIPKGNPMIAVDLPGVGETAPEEKPGPFGKEWRETFLTIHLGRPLLGLRVDCVNALVEGVAADILVGQAELAPVALHVAALDSRVKQLHLDGMVLSWSSVAQATQSRNQLANAVPGALKSYDLPDLAAALAPRPLTIRNPVDPMGKPVTQAELEAAYAKVREAYKAAGAEKNLVLEVKP